MQPSKLQSQVLQVSQGDGVRTSREHCLVGEFLAASSENFEDSLIYNNRMTFFIANQRLYMYKNRFLPPFPPNPPFPDSLDASSTAIFFGLTIMK